MQKGRSVSSQSLTDFFPQRTYHKPAAPHTPQVSIKQYSHSLPQPSQSRLPDTICPDSTANAFSQTSSRKRENALPTTGNPPPRPARPPNLCSPAPEREETRCARRLRVPDARRPYTQKPSLPVFMQTRPVELMQRERQMIRGAKVWPS